MDQNNMENQAAAAQAQVQAETSAEPVVSQVMAPAFDGPVTLLKSAWGMFKNNWKVLVSIAAIPNAINFVGQIFSLSFDSTKNPLLIIVGALIMIIGFVLLIAMQPALINAFKKITTAPGVTISIKQEYRLGLKLFWSLIFVMIIQSFFVVGSGIPALIPIFVVGSGIPTLIRMIVVGLGILALIPMIVVAVYSILYLYELVLEGKRGYKSFEASYALIYGRWWPVLGRILFLILLALIALFIVGFAGGFVSGFFGFVDDSIQEAIPLGLFSLFFSVTMGVIASAYLYFMYLSLVKTKRTVPEDSIAKFGKWLKALTVIGVIIIPLSIIVSVVLISISPQ